MTGVSGLINRFEQKIANNSVESLRAEYARVIRPAYVRRYGGASLPRELFVDESDLSLNGGGGPGIVLVSLGVAKEPIACLRTFAVAHETGHAVAFIELQRVGVLPFQPIGDDAKRHEHMADLIAMRVLKEYLPTVASAIAGNLGQLSKALGAGGPMHPSGLARTEMIRKLYCGYPFGPLFAALATRAIPV